MVRLRLREKEVPVAQLEKWIPENRLENGGIRGKVDMCRSLNGNMLCSKKFDPRLREIIAAWPSLPKLVANGLHAMVQAMTKS